MKDYVLQVALLQVSIMMFTSALFIAFWTYFYIAYEAISFIQLAGYYMIWIICGANFFVLGPIGLIILISEIKWKCITRTTLSCYILLCFLSFAPTPLLFNVFSKGEDTRQYLHNFYLKYGRVPFLMDYIQRSHHCCGYNNYTDYYNNSGVLEDDDVALNEPVPVSCCNEIQPGCQMSIALTYKAGCFVSPGTNLEMTAWEHPYHGTGFLPVVLIPIVLPLLQFLHAFFLYEAFAKLENRNTKRGVVVQNKNEEDEEDVVHAPVQNTSNRSNNKSKSSSSRSSSATGSSSSNRSVGSKSVSGLVVLGKQPVKSPIGIKTLFMKDTKRYKSSSATNVRKKKSESKYSKESSEGTEYSSQSSLPSELFLSQEEAFKLVSNYFERLPNADGIFDHEMVTHVAPLKRRASEDEASFNNNHIDAKGPRQKSDDGSKSRSKYRSYVVVKEEINEDVLEYKSDDNNSQKSGKSKHSDKSRGSGKSENSGKSHTSKKSDNSGKSHNSEKSNDSGKSHDSGRAHYSEKTQETRKFRETDDYSNKWRKSRESIKSRGHNSKKNRTSIQSRDRSQPRDSRDAIESRYSDEDYASDKSRDRRQSKDTKDSRNDKKSLGSGRDYNSAKNHNGKVATRDRNEQFDLIKKTRERPKTRSQSDFDETRNARHYAEYTDNDDNVRGKTKTQQRSRSRDSGSDKDQRIVVYINDDRKSRGSDNSHDSGGKRPNENREPEKSTENFFKEEIFPERQKSSGAKSRNTENLIQTLFTSPSTPKETDSSSEPSQSVRKKSQTSKITDKQSRSVVPATSKKFNYYPEVEVTFAYTDANGVPITAETKDHQPHLALVPQPPQRSPGPDPLHPHDPHHGGFVHPPSMFSHDPHHGGFGHPPSMFSHGRHHEMHHHHPEHEHHHEHHHLLGSLHSRHSHGYDHHLGQHEHHHEHGHHDPYQHTHHEYHEHEHHDPHHEHEQTHHEHHEHEHIHHEHHDPHHEHEHTHHEHDHHHHEHGHHEQPHHAGYHEHEHYGHGHHHQHHQHAGHHEHHLHHSGGHHEHDHHHHAGHNEQHHGHHDHHHSHR